MRHLRRSAFLRFVVLPFTLSLWLSACTSYVAMQAPLDQAIAREQPGKVRVTLDGGTQSMITRPRVERDSLVGFVYDAGARAYTDTIRVAMKDVVYIEQQKTQGPDPGLILAVVLVGGVIGWKLFLDRLDEQLSQ